MNVAGYIDSMTHFWAKDWLRIREYTCMLVNSMRRLEPDRFAVQKTVHWRYSAQLLQISLNYA